MAAQSWSDMYLIGLDEPQASVYAAVLGSEAASTDAIVESLGLDSGVVEAALDVLRAKGLVTRAASALNVHVAVDPRDALTTVVDHLMSDLGGLRARIPAYGERYDQVRRLTATGEGSSASKVLVDPMEIAGWYARLQQRAKTSFRVFDRPPYVSTPVEPLEEASMARGVQVRAIYVVESFHRHGAWEETLRLASLGEQSRMLPTLPTKMAIADDHTVLMSLGVDSGHVEALLSTANTVVSMMSEVFEHAWRQALPLGDSASKGIGTATAVLAPRDRQMVALIGSGASDDAIASRLGISARSVRRRSHALMERLGAENRFQFGVLATRSGWL